MTNTPNKTFTNHKRNIKLFVLLLAASQQEGIGNSMLFSSVNAPSNIDDKYCVDVDYIYEIEHILPKEIKEKYSTAISPSVTITEGKQFGLLSVEKL